MTTDLLAYQLQSQFSFQDKRFNLAKTTHYHLAILLGSHNLRLCAIDQLSNRCLLIESYNLQINDASSYIQVIQALWEKHHCLNNKSWNQVTLSIANQKYTLIPQTLFQAQAAETYLNLVTDISHHTALYHIHTQLGLVVAFAVEPQLLDWFQTTYPQNQLLTIHQGGSLIAGNMIYYHTKKLSKDPQVFAHIETDCIHITILTKTQLLYYNRLPYQDSDEMLQYLLIAMYTLGLDPSKQELLISGHMFKNSLEHRKFKNYIRQVTFSAPPPQLKFGWMLDKSIFRYHFDLLNIYSCRI
jgi:hypothetical protein